VTVLNANTNGLLNGATGTITGTPTSAGTYTISILAYERANASGDAFGPATVRFTIAGAASAAPTISTHPISQTTTAGGNITLTVGANGSPSPSYQWQKDSVPITGATTSTLTLTNVQAADAGIYVAVVTNSAGSATSNPATLSVNASGPAISVQPQSQHVVAGANVSLSVVASGTGLSYQWKKDGVAIPGATNSTLPLSNSSGGTMGFYGVTVSSPAGSS